MPERSIGLVSKVDPASPSPQVTSACGDFAGTQAQPSADLTLRLLDVALGSPEPKTFIAAALALQGDGLVRDLLARAMSLDDPLRSLVQAAQALLEVEAAKERAERERERRDDAAGDDKVIKLA